MKALIIAANVGFVFLASSAMADLGDSTPQEHWVCKSEIFGPPVDKEARHGDPDCYKPGDFTGFEKYKCYDQVRDTCTNLISGKSRSVDHLRFTRCETLSYNCH